MKSLRVLALFLFSIICVGSAAGQLTVNVAAGGDVVSAAYQVLAAGGGTINLAAGAYNITSNIVLGANTTLNGAGGPNSTTQTVIYAPASPNSIAMVTQAYAGASNLTISNLVLDGNIPQAAMLYGTGGGNYAYNNDGILIYDQSATTVGVTLTNLEVRHTLRGILTGLVDNLTISYCYFHDNNPGGFSHNMYLVASSGVEIDHTRSDNALLGDGLHIDFGGLFYTIRKSEFSGNNGLGILSQQDNNVTVEDSIIDSNTNDGLQIDAGGLVLDRNEMNYNGNYGLNIPDTADNAGQVNGLYTVGDAATDYFYGASINDFTLGNPNANVYAAVQAYGVNGVTDTADWTLAYPGYTYMGAVDFNANHLANGSITFPYVGAVIAGAPGYTYGYYVLTFRYANGTSSTLPMNLSVNGGTPTAFTTAVNFAPTGSNSTWSTVNATVALNVGNSSVTLSLPTGAAAAPEIDTMTVNTVVPNAPDAPTNLTATAAGPYQINLSWTAPDTSNYNAAQTYTVYRNNSYPPIAVNVVGTTYSDTRIFYGETTNSYTVVANNQGGNSANSNSASATTGLDAPPGLQVSVHSGTGTNSLTWLGTSGAVAYNVGRSIAAGGPYTNIGTVTTTSAYPSYADSMLSTGVTYYYAVTAVDANNVVSANSYQVTAVPQTFTLSASASSVNLSSITPDTITVVGTNGFSDAVSFAVSGLPAGVTASLSAASGSSTQVTFTASTAATTGNYPVTVTGTDGVLTSSVGVTVVVGNGQLAQTITFATVPSQNVGVPLVAIATASSGLPITFTVVQNGNCSVSGNVVTFLHVGACGVIANQNGNSSFAAAASVGQVITVNGGTPIITLNIPNTHTITSTITLSPTSTSGGGFAYGIVSGPATVSGNVLTLTGGGTVVVSIYEYAYGDYNQGSAQVSFTSIAGSVWLGSANSALSTFDLTGSLISPTAGFLGGGLSTPAGPQAMAFDASGNLWVASSGSAGISEFTMTGTPATSSPFTATGIANPAALAIDGSSNVWVVNSSGSVVVLSNAGAVLATTTDSSISGATGIAIDNSGSVWVSNSSANTVDEIIGGAAPTAPLANALKNGTVGGKP